MLPSLPARPCMLRVILSLKSKCFARKDTCIWCIFQQKNGNCWILNINSLVFALSIYTCVCIINAIMLISNRNLRICFKRIYWRFHITTAAAVRLSCEHYFRKFPRFRTAAARPSYEIVKTYGSGIIADPFSGTTF